VQASNPSCLSVLPRVPFYIVYSALQTGFAVGLASLGTLLQTKRKGFGSKF